MTVEQLRQQIDRLDDRIVTLLNRRATLGLRVGALKRRQGRRVFDRQREQTILRRISRINRGPLSAAAVQTIYRRILAQVRRLERAA